MPDKYIATSRLQKPKDELSTTERNSLREAAGQLSWLVQATQYRPGISYDVLDLTMSVKNAIVEYLKQANEVVKVVKGVNVDIRFPFLGKPEELRLVAFF